MSFRNLAVVLALTLASGTGLLAGCGDSAPTSRYESLRTDTSLSDEQAVQQMASNIRKIGGFDSRAELATVTSDADGRPSIAIRFNPDISDSSSQLVAWEEGGRTLDSARRDHVVSLNVVLMMSDFGDILRVGAARSLQQVEFTILTRVATDAGDREFEVLHATLPRGKIEALAALPRDEFGQVDIDVSEHWTIVKDSYDEISFGPGD